MPINYTGRKWSTADCGRCHQEHLRLPSAISIHDVEYVVCPETELKLPIQKGETIGLSFAFATTWQLDETVPVIKDKPSGKHWATDKCGRCGNEHQHLTGFRDLHGTEYVICYIYNKRMNILPRGPSACDMYPTAWRRNEVKVCTGSTN